MLSEWLSFIETNVVSLLLSSTSSHPSPDCIVAAEGCDFSIADCTDGGGSLPFLGGDDEADGIEADEDEEQEDADAANADADSATPFAVVGNSIGTILAAAVALAFMNAAA